MELVVSGADSNGGEGMVLKEIQGSDGVKAIAWLEDSVIVGTNDGYRMFSCASGQCSPLFLLPETASPCLKPMWRHKEAVLLVDTIITSPLSLPVGGTWVFLNAPDCVGQIGTHLAALRGEKWMFTTRRQVFAFNRYLLTGRGWVDLSLWMKKVEEGIFLLLQQVLRPFVSKKCHQTCKLKAC